MKTLNYNHLLLLLFPILLLQLSSCKTTKSVATKAKLEIQASKLNGGSSGMEKIADNAYLIVYDIKSYKAGTRLALMHASQEEMQISPIAVDGWGTEGIASDLESICKVSGKTNEYFIAEAGNWEGKIGRIFHIQVDTAKLTAKVLGVTKLPFKHINNMQLVGDQYESMACLPYNQDERILLLAERGGSTVNPIGNVKWGIYNLRTHKLNFSEAGLKGIEANAPGKWNDTKTKRDITDIHIDANGAIWAAASEDISEAGPFYSVIYKIGQVDLSNKKQPFNIFRNFTNWEVVSGFKIEALSGPAKGINCTHSFGTEDEMYGGVWRPITIK